MSFVQELKEKVLVGEEIRLDEARQLYDEREEELFHAACEIRERMCGSEVDLCAILNAKSGGCEEDCTYCAQSRHYFTGIQEYPLVDSKTAIAHAQENEKRRGIKRFSLVTSGRALNGEEFERIVKIYEVLQKETSLSLCASLGCLSYEQLCVLRSVGVSRYHHNLETGPRFFSSLCSTHTFEDRVNTIRATKEAGLEVCSGGIFGVGESIEDRIDMACVLRSLGVTSVPINILVPIKGTPLENQYPLSSHHIYRTIAVYRFLLPKAFLRLAGGRLMLPDRGKTAYRAGVNAALVGNLLTTVGVSIEQEYQMIREAGLSVSFSYVS